MLCVIAILCLLCLCLLSLHQEKSRKSWLALRPLDASDVETLSEALPHYNILESVSLAHFEINDSAAFSCLADATFSSDII